MDTVEKIFELLKQKGISEKKFSHDLNLGKDKLSQWKMGKTTSYKDYIVEIADYFGVTTDYLLRDNEKNKNTANLSEDEQEVIDVYQTLSKREKTMIKGEMYKMQLLKEQSQKNRSDTEFATLSEISEQDAEKINFINSGKIKNANK